MSFTPITVLADRVSPDGTPAVGTITFTLNAPMTNGVEVAEPTPILGREASGALTTFANEPLVLLAVDDLGTTPTDPAADYLVTESFDGATASYSVIISHTATVAETAGSTTNGSAIVGLANVVPTATMVGRLITGTNIPALATVLSVDVAGMTLEMSAPATATATRTCAFAIGGVVDLSTL